MFIFKRSALLFSLTVFCRKRKKLGGPMKKLSVSFSLALLFLFFSFAQAADRVVETPLNCSSPVYVSGTETSSFHWPMFLPAIISGGGCNIGPLWGVNTIICCPSSSLTFSVTISGKTKRSIKSACGVAPTWDGWQETTAGTKSVSYEVFTLTCGIYRGTFPLVMEKGKAYGFELDLVNNVLKIIIYSGDACTITQNSQITESRSLLEGTIGMEEKGLQKVNEIRLDIPPGAFKAK